MREAAIVAKIMTWLRAQPDIFAYKIHGDRYGLRGLPDIAGNAGPVAFYLEVKGPRGRLSKIQQAMARRISRSGGNIWCVRSLEDAICAIESLRKKS